MIVNYNLISYLYSNPEQFIQHQSIHEDAECLDIENIRRRLTDEYARKLIIQECNCATVTEFQSLSLIEKELYGKRSIDSYTHDADKMILYLLGFPKSFVSKFHREHSVHHVESGKKPNLRSMLCDNIASSPEFKPEKKNSLRKYYSISKELQSVKGFGEMLEKYNFGEDIDFAKIKRIKAAKFEGLKGLARVAVKSLVLLFA